MRSRNPVSDEFCASEKVNSYEIIPIKKYIYILNTCKSIGIANFPENKCAVNDSAMIKGTVTSLLNT